MKPELVTKSFGAARRRPWYRAGLPTAAFWLAAVFAALWLSPRWPRGWGMVGGLLEVLTGIALVVVLVVWLAKVVQRRMLWSLRNKLILTYLLLGVLPVMLLLTLMGISTYVAAGQFAIHLADSRLRSELIRMGLDNAHQGAVMARNLDQGSALPLSMPQAGPPGPRPGGPAAAGQPPRAQLRPQSGAFIDGVALGEVTQPGRSPLSLPVWALELRQHGFHELVLDNNELYLVVLYQRRLNDGRMFSLVQSLPVDASVMQMVGDGLGLTGIHLRRTTEDGPAEPDSADSSSLSSNGQRTRARFWVYGGTEPAAQNLADIRVQYLSTVQMTDWDTGKADQVAIRVLSRPSLLYRQLFGATLGGVVTNVIRDGLIGLCVLFGLIELLALVMSVRLIRTITASIADLYEATQQIDRGELEYRIGVTQSDQLAELSHSFNRMTASLKRLLGEQQEKERMQSELSIAQEVQANLFPTKMTNLPTLELHGVCRPARSVSGDYYDFLLFHEDDLDGKGRRETGVGIALGDISGKGISAALLMATLHSAVRAYRFASEELVYGIAPVGVGGGTPGVRSSGVVVERAERRGENIELFESPGRILSLLNRHLYRSTQPEKYATLFLAHYEAATSMLTYSNAGQLPPLVLSRDGSIRRLDCGGTVVGLMDGMEYEEDRFKMQSGDILVAYSDGVTEPENDFGDFGEDRMMEVVSRYRDQPLEAISMHLMKALDEWIGPGEQPDDITLVLARQL